MMAASPKNEEGAKALLTGLGQAAAIDACIAVDPSVVAANSKAEHRRLQRAAAEVGRAGRRGEVHRPVPRPRHRARLRGPGRRQGDRRLPERSSPSTGSLRLSRSRSRRIRSSERTDEPRLMAIETGSIGTAPAGEPRIRKRVERQGGAPRGAPPPLPDLHTARSPVAHADGRDPRHPPHRAGVDPRPADRRCCRSPNGTTCSPSRRCRRSGSGTTGRSSRSSTTGCSRRCSTT